MRSLSLRAAVATRMRLWDQIRRALRGPRQTQNLDLRPAHDPIIRTPGSTIAACRHLGASQTLQESVKRNPDAFQDDASRNVLERN